MKRRNMYILIALCFLVACGIIAFRMAGGAANSGSGSGGASGSGSSSGSGISSNSGSSRKGAMTTGDLFEEIMSSPAYSSRTQDYLDAHEVGLMYGNDSTAEAVYNSIAKIVEKKDTMLCGSGAIFQSMNSTVTMNLGVIFRLKGINLTVSGACASGSHAIGLGALLIQNGLQEMVVCGGAQEVNMAATGSFDGISAFSMREDNPTAASRPFDRDRDGLIPSGGAATVILESYESAVRRGAPILAEVLGYGFSANGDHISSPNVDGPARSLEMAIRRSGVSLQEIGYVNAHATSTHVGDANEAKALLRVLGEKTVPITSTKSQTGHEMWMAGASEVIYSILMMKGGFVAPNINFENPDEDSCHLWIPATRLERKFDTFLSNSFGFGGTNSTLIIRNV